MIKAVKILNLFSVLLFTSILLLIYAYLPIQVELYLEEVKSLHKQTLFYYVFAAFIVLNVSLIVITNLLLKKLSEIISAWVKSFIFVVNFYLTTLIAFIGVINNATHLKIEDFVYLMYVSPIILALWCIGLIYLWIKKKI